MTVVSSLVFLFMLSFIRLSQTAVVYVAWLKAEQEIWIFIPIKCQILWPLHDIEDESLAGGYK